MKIKTSYQNSVILEKPVPEGKVYSSAAPPDKQEKDLKQPNFIHSKKEWENNKTNPKLSWLKKKSSEQK